MNEVIYKSLFDGLEVSYDGQFKRNGKPHKVTYSYTVTGNKATARLVYKKTARFTITKQPSWWQWHGNRNIRMGVISYTRTRTSTISMPTI